MDNNQLLITWAIVVFVALGLDVGAYLFLRAEWKKSGVLLTDKLWNQLSDKLDQSVKAERERLLSLIRPKPKQLSLPDAPQPIIDDPVEIIPVSVKTVGQVRRVEFSMDMALNTTVNVRIGATKEAGVKVEKREL
ncbi:MAG: hypothetical protein WA821_23140 [Anaerolineales bacterium]